MGEPDRYPGTDEGGALDPGHGGAGPRRVRVAVVCLVVAVVLVMAVLHLTGTLGLGGH